MMDENKKQIGISIDDMMFMGLMVILPILSVLITSLILFITIKNGNKVTELIQTYLVMSLSFVILPGILLYKKYGLSLHDIGIMKLKNWEILISLILLIILYVYLIGKVDRNTLILLSVQTIAVAVCEEVWARGMLFYVIGKFTQSHFVMILFSSIIFTFLIHINRGFYNNLIYRLPGAILMCVVYDRSKKLHYSIMVHYMYNMLASF